MDTREHLLFANRKMTSETCPQYFLGQTVVGLLELSTAAETLCSCVERPVSHTGTRDMLSVPPVWWKGEGDWYQWGNWFVQAGGRTVFDLVLSKYQYGCFLKVSRVCLHKPKERERVCVCVWGWWRIINAASSLAITFTDHFQRGKRFGGDVFLPLNSWHSSLWLLLRFPFF